MDRESFRKLFLDADSILEVSPFTAPIFNGSNVRYADILSRVQLVERATKLGLEVGKVPEIHYVVEPGRFASSIKEKFQIVSSSHVIEHTPDLVAHFCDIAPLLEERGKYCVVIPDSRYCFDHFLSPSSIADVIQASHEKRERHTKKSVIEHLALLTHNVAGRHWLGLHGDLKVKSSKVLEAIKIFDDSEASGSWLDVHSWQFTPNSFEEVITLTNELGLQPFSVEKIYATKFGQLEFFGILQLNG
jgi:hypothetical protein